MSHSKSSVHETGERNSIGRQRHATHCRTLIIGGVLPITIALVATLLMMSWLPELPDPIAVHWSGAGADGFGPALPFMLTPLAIVLAFSVFVVATSWRTAPSGALLFNQKILVVMAVLLSTMMSVGFVGSIAVQRGLAEAKESPDVGVLLAIGAAAGVVLAVASWFLLPPGVSSAVEVGQQPKPVDLYGGERLSWSHTARLGNIGLMIVALAFVWAIGIVIFASFAAQSSVVFAIVILVFVAVLVVTTTWWRVSADRRGFTVRGALGWPVKRIPLEDIRTVQVVDVTPTRDFGGYGWRWTVDGRSGVILRAGSGIEVTASSGKRFVVTVDDAETGAGVIAAMLTQPLSHSA